MLLFVLMMLTVNPTLHAQLVVDSDYAAENLINDFFAETGVTLFNITYSGSPLADGFFDGSNCNLGLDAGLVLSTGKVDDMAATSSTVFLSTNLGISGDPAFTDTWPKIQDAALVELYFISTEPTVMFHYVFASEEYPEYSDSIHHDFFAIAINGPAFRA